MPGAAQVQKPRRTRETAPAEDVRTRDAHVRTAEEREAAAAELDGLLDEIDDVLEENAAQFVAEYVQKGGE